MSGTITSASQASQKHAQNHHKLPFACEVVNFHLQLHKQMAICGGFGRVFEIGPVFRAEDSYTHRHLCEFTGLDVEMEIKEHYFEVMDVVDQFFVMMFDCLNERCQKELEAIGKQIPFEPLKVLVFIFHWIALFISFK
ncbi:Aspartate--tRNA ligase 2, cytoplasmic [Sarracenia purpurea var. burkii]